MSTESEAEIISPQDVTDPNADKFEKQKMKRKLKVDMDDLKPEELEN